jgi:hypothetical protein
MSGSHRNFKARDCADEAALVERRSDPAMETLHTNTESTANTVSRKSLSRRELIRIFVLFNLLFWVAAIWFFTR